jgi:uncharacterized protein YwqG
MLKEGRNLIKGERVWINKVKSNFLNSKILADYSLWLKKQNDNRSTFVENLSKALEKEDKKLLPSLSNEDAEWIEAIGFTHAQQMFLHKCIKFKENIARLAKPSFLINSKAKEDNEILIGASKFGGEPDLPKNFAWPTGNECTSGFIYDTKGEDRFAGFIGQINFHDIKEAQESEFIPGSGILSLFCFNDLENDIEKITLGAFYFPEDSTLVRKKYPPKITEGNERMKSKEIHFQEVLDLPETEENPWSNDYESDLIENWEFFDHFRYIYFDNFLGYSRATRTNDQTISKNHQPLAIIENAAGCRLFLQIHNDDLKNKRFEKTIIGFVDFD